MRVLSVANYEQWQAFARPWNLLTRGVPFRSWEWLSAWWRNYGTTGELLLLIVLDDQGTVVGAAPWYLEHAGSRGRVIRPLGSGEVCSDYSSLLCTPEFETHVSCAVANWLVTDGDLFHWDLLDLECVPRRDSATGKLLNYLEAFGCSVLKRPGLNLWSIDLPDSWHDYLQQLSKSHRKQINRLLRNFWDCGRAQLEIADTRAEVQRAMELLLDLHQRRWQVLGKPGVFASQRFRAFLSEVAEELQPHQGLQLCTLKIDGRPAAVDFHLVTGLASFVYQGGIEPDLIHQAPGKLLTAVMIREAIFAGRRSFDFLRGDEPYKPHFRATPTETMNVHVVPKRTAAQLRHSLWMTGVVMKKLVKSGLTLTGMHQHEH